MGVVDSVFVHPSALCETADVGPGTRIWAFAHVMEGVRIGRNCSIGDHAFIETGVVIGDRVTVKNQVLIWEGIHIEDDAFIGPGVVFTNDLYPRSPRMDLEAVCGRYRDRANWLRSTRVCRGASLGAGAVIGPGITLAEYSMVGAGSLISRSVAAHQMVFGNPGRARGWVCVCGLPLKPKGSSLWTCQCDLRFRETTEGQLEPIASSTGDV